MSQTIITLAFEEYKAQQEALLQPVDLNEFVLANVPDQDPTLAIDREEGLPKESEIVFVHAVTQKGYVNGNAVVYSLTMDTEVGDFYFNWIGLRNKATGVIAAISHLPSISKSKTIIGVQDGNAITRSIMMSYSNAKNLTGIHVDASTWQIDFTARLLGIDERERLANVDHYGLAAFLAEGFKVVKVGESYQASAGVGYLGGLRCEQANAITLKDAVASSAIYLDASFQGELTSRWNTVHKFTVSQSLLKDYVDESGFTHYVTKIADIDAKGNVVDTRLLGGTPSFERIDNAASNSDIDATSTAVKHIKLPQLWRAFSNAHTAHKNEANPHTQYERIDNAASNSEIDTSSTAVKHIKLPQLWRAFSNAHTAHKNEANPHTQYERIDNAASNSEIDATSTAVKHIKLPQLWRAFSNAHTVHKNEANPHTQYERIDNAASNSDIDASSTAVKHIKLPQLWRAISNKLLARTIATTSPLKGGGNLSSNLTLSIDSATTSKKGAVQLTNSVTSTSTTLAASAKAVKAAYDKASLSGGAVGDVITRPVDNISSYYLECNGAAISRTTYPELFAVIGTSFGKGNGSTTFNLPDYRGEFLRGWDHGRGVDTGRSVGSWQGEAFKSHSHSGTVSLSTVTALETTPNLPGTLKAEGINGHDDNDNSSGGSSSGGSSSDGSSSVAVERNYNLSINNTGGTETRPRNRAVMFCIRYKE